MRSYFTYKQLALRAVIELQDTHPGSSFHRRTIHAKIRDFELAEGFELGEFWVRHVKKAIEELVKAKVFRKGRDIHRIALSPYGLKKLALFRERYGSLGDLSPFKKSQFLKAIAGTSRVTHPDYISTEFKSKDQLIASLGATLERVEKEKEHIFFELESTRQKYDDLQLDLLEMGRPPMPPSQLSDPVATLPGGLHVCDQPPAPSQSPLEAMTPFNRDSSPTPSPALNNQYASIPSHTDPRPTASFIPRFSGSFLNTLSKHFTPSPSPGPSQARSPTIHPGGASPFHRGSNDGDSDNFDFGDVEMGDVGGSSEGDTIVGKQSQSDVSRGKQVQRDTSDQNLDLNPERATTANDAQMLETLQQLAVANEERDVVMQERDSLQDDVAELNATLGDSTKHIDYLKADLATTAQAFRSLHVQKDECEQARVAMKTENARLSNEITNRTREVSKLRDRVDEISTEIILSNAQRDDAQTQLASASSRLEEAEKHLQATRTELAAAQAQLRDVQDNLRAIGNELQGLRERTQAQLASAQLEFNTIRSELDQTKADLNSTSAQLNVTNNQLQDSNAQLDAKNEQLVRAAGELQLLRDAIIQAGTLEHSLRDEIINMSEQFKTSHAELVQVTQQSAARERGLKSDLEDTQERNTILEEELQDAWTQAVRISEQAAADLVEKRKQSLNRQRTQKRDPSFRDSGISITK